jgi:hypothetical protein
VGYLTALKHLIISAATSATLDGDERDHNLDLAEDTSEYAVAIKMDTEEEELPT